MALVVDQRPRRVLMTAQRQCLGRVHGLVEDLKATLSEQLGRYVEEARVIIDNQDPNRHVVMMARRLILWL